MKVLRDLDFSAILCARKPSSTTGQNLVEKYKAYCSVNPVSYAIVNRFIAEAKNCRYDNGVNKIFEEVADYIACNKISWALGSACESISADQSSRNMLNRNAAKQVEKLLEMEEEDVVKYIRSGALKNVMYCESFRTIAKSVFNNRMLVETTPQYMRVTPVSITEHDANGCAYFVVEGKLYKINENKEVSEEAAWAEVSNTFKTLSRTLAGRNCEIDENTIIMNISGVQYVIEQADKITRVSGEDKKEYTALELREHANNLLVLTSQRNRAETAALLECTSLIAEKYNEICSMDNVSVYTTGSDKFVVIEEGDSTLYSELLASNHSGAWCVNEDALKTCEFVRSKTGLNLIGEYKNAVDSAIKKADEESAIQIKEKLEQDKISSLKSRIEKLTETYKNDPAKLAVLSKLATEIQSV